jgi:hypothetical protein
VTIADALVPDALDQLRENLSRNTRKIEPILSKKANYWNGNLAEGGKLHVTKAELVFVPHAFNFNSGYRLVFPFETIANLQKENSMLGLVRELHIHTKDGQVASFVVWGQDQVINCVANQLG